MEESFAKRYWQTNGNWGLEANTGMHFNFFSSSFHRVQIYTLVQRDRKTHLFRGRGIHTGAHAQHTTRSKRTQTMLQVLIYIQWKCLFILAVISLWLLIPMCLCVPKCELSFSCLIWCFNAIWCVRAEIFLCLCESVVMCLGYQVWESRQPPVLAGHRKESSYDGSASSSSFLCSIFFQFDSQTQ